VTKCGGAVLVPATETTPEHVYVCPIRDGCLRYTNEINKVFQEWFAKYPGNVKTGKCKECVTE
jgi:hypothetical protein